MSRTSRPGDVSLPDELVEDVLLPKTNFELGGMFELTRVTLRLPR